MPKPLLATLLHILGFWLCIPGPTLVLVVKGYQCNVCDRTLCAPPPKDCPGGQALDSCDCCLVCGRVEGERCQEGGAELKEKEGSGDGLVTVGVKGRCDKGLVCMIDPTPGALLEGWRHEGVCQATGTTLTPPIDCDRTTCKVVFIGECPSDSMVVGDQLPAGQCCPEPPSCQCLPCVQQLVQCPRDQVKVIVSEGGGKPGHCCDSFDCRPKEEVCTDVKCEEDYLADVRCPEDSEPLAVLITQGGCCTQHQGCKCKTLFECEPVNCPRDQRPEIVKAMGLPGDCCDSWICVNVSVTCNHQDKEYADGEVWQYDACNTCRCDGGLTFCERKQCEEQTQCNWFTVPPGECCHVCRGCATDQGAYLNGATWKKSDCVACRCEEGQVYCQAQLCSINCAHPHKVPGECCPVCETNETFIAWPSHCPSLRGCDVECDNGLVMDEYGCAVCQCKPPEVVTECPLDCSHGYKEDPITGSELCECQPSIRQCPSLDDCSIECLYGYRRDKDGCAKCKCRKCPSFECKKKCPHGFAHNNKGCQLCKCLPRVTEPPTSLVPTPAPGGRVCMSLDGHLMEDGQTWHDGCRRCFCHLGREMCALISCPVPRCRYPFIKGGDCCPTCGDNTMLTPSLTSHCLTEEGIRLSEGETWLLDECTLCICHDGGMLCEIESCPPVLCHHPVILRGRCCPVCPADDSSLPPSLLPGKGGSDHMVCRSPSGGVYTHGDTWRVNPCQSCVCREGQIHCFSQTCPITDCERTTLKKGQCCSTCSDTHTRLHKQCVHEGVEYAEGEVWMLNDCTRCFCVDGQPMCADEKCFDLPEDCPQVIFLPGICCPQCTNVTLISIDVDKEDKTSDRRNHRPEDRHPGGDLLPSSLRLTLGILIPIIIVLASLVLLLFFILLRRRRARSHDLPHSASISHFTQTQGDYKKRPKSTNLDLQGIDPFLNEKKLQAVVSATMMNDYTPLPGVTTAANEYSTVNEYATLEGLHTSVINNEYTPLTGSDNKAVVMNDNKVWRYSCGADGGTATTTTTGGDDLNKAAKVLLCDNNTTSNRYSL